jgi:hypothetical protein
MPNRSRTTRWMLLLGVVLSLAFLGFTQTRPVLKAQEPAKVVDKKALREQIIALKVEIDLLEIEQGIDRPGIVEMFKQERSLPAQFDEFESLIKSNKQFQDAETAEKFLSWGGDTWAFLFLEETIDDDELRKKASEQNQETKNYLLQTNGKEIAQSLESLVKITGKEEFSKARRSLAGRVKEDVMKKAAESAREKSAPLKNKYTLRSAEIAGKKLDLTTLERQYHEAR